MHLCPCGSKHPFEQCCEPFIFKKQSPNIPEQLMRSRYTAYSLAKTDYLKNTMKGKPRLNFNELEVAAWAKNVTWISLNVIEAYNESPDKGFVTFIATYLEGNQLRFIHELSEFHKEDNAWYYVDGIMKSDTQKAQKVMRNHPCPCGSGRKFKNCHGS